MFMFTQEPPHQAASASYGHVCHSQGLAEDSAKIQQACHLILPPSFDPRSRRESGTAPAPSSIAVTYLIPPRKAKIYRPNRPQTHRLNPPPYHPTPPCRCGLSAVKTCVLIDVPARR